MSSMFEGCSSLSSITVGGGYAMTSPDMFPEPTSGDRWWSTAGNGWYARDEIVSDRNGVEDTYLSADPSGPSIKSHLLVLTGRIGVNFYCDLSALSPAERQDSYMEFELSGKTMRDGYDASHMNRDGACYGFTCPVNAVQMAERITATLHWGDGQAVRQTYSVEDYVVYVITH